MVKAHAAHPSELVKLSHASYLETGRAATAERLSFTRFLAVRLNRREYQLYGQDHSDFRSFTDHIFH